MSLKRHWAIVLKNYYPKKQTLALLDGQLGKVTGASAAIAEISAGSFIAYSVDARRTNYLLLHQIELLDLPLFIAHEDILFLHHLLELCYYFIPDGSNALSVFNLLQMVYTPGDWMSKTVLKKIFLCKLFAFLGIYPEEESMKTPAYSRLMSTTFTEVMDMVFQQEDEHIIDSWLRMCIASHPIAGKFKTVHFLDAHRNV